MNIGDMCEKADLTPDTLRYYERIGLIPTVKRTPGGLRNYGDDDLLWIEYIKCMHGDGDDDRTTGEVRGIVPAG